MPGKAIVSGGQIRTVPNPGVKHPGANAPRSSERELLIAPYLTKQVDVVAEVLKRHSRRHQMV
jgi:hypothetical protein